MKVAVTFLTLKDAPPQDTPMGPMPGGQTTALETREFECDHFHAEWAGSEHAGEVVVFLYDEQGGPVAAYSMQRVVSVERVG